MSSAFRWSGISMVARELSRIAFTIAIARLIGPMNFGIVAQATVFIGIVTLLLDQGFSSVLIQRKSIESELPGAIVSANIAIGTALVAITVGIAPLWASFMHTPALALILAASSPSLIFRSLALAPRAMLVREMEFRKIAIADAVAALVSGPLGLFFAIVWKNYWALVVQVVSADAIVLGCFLFMGVGYRPNLRVRILREVAGYSGRVFAANLLFGAISRNIDSLLVGRFLGAQPLAFYGLAYRLLLLPVQLTGTALGEVLFSVFSRIADNKPALKAEMERTTRTLAVLSVPPLALVAASAPELVTVLFGSQWKPAIPLVQVLALVGASQAIYRPTTGALLMGTGRPELMLRWAWLFTIVTSAGIVAGLPFGVLGVAVGYSIAYTVLLPMQWMIRQRLLGMTIGSQLASLAPACNVSLWVAVTYFIISTKINGEEFVTLLCGVSAAALAGIATLYLMHRSLLRELTRLAKRVLGKN